MNQQRHFRIGGFVFLTAVLFLAMVAAAMLALADVASSDARNTGSQIERAQLRQLLLAAAADARLRLAQNSPAPGQRWELELPQSLPGAHVAGEVVLVNDSRADVSITANSGRMQMRQRLQMEKLAAGWIVVSGRLDPADPS